MVEPSNDLKFRSTSFILHFCVFALQSDAVGVPSYYCKYGRFILVEYNCISGEDPDGTVCANEGEFYEARCYWTYGTKDGKGACGWCMANSADADTKGTV